MKIPVRFPLKITRKLTGSTRNGLSFVAAYRHFEGRADDEIICAIAELFRPLALAMLGREETEVRSAIAESKAYLESYYRIALGYVGEEIYKTASDGYSPSQVPDQDFEDDDNELEELDYD